MKESNLPKGPNREKKRLGRGEGNGHGKTCCRGHKGAGARSGYSLRPGFEVAKCHFSVNYLSEASVKLGLENHVRS